MNSNLLQHQRNPENKDFAEENADSNEVRDGPIKDDNSAPFQRNEIKTELDKDALFTNQLDLQKLCCTFDGGVNAIRML